MDYAATYNTLAEKYLGRPLRKPDAVSEALICAEEKRLGVPLPQAIRSYYRVAGNAHELNTIHNQLYSLGNLQLEGDHLIFMDENQSAISWGLRVDDLGEKDPTVWQRNNTPPVEWFSEEMSFTAFMKSMFEWYLSIEMWNDA